MAFTSFTFIPYHPICDCHPGNIKPVLPEKVSSAQVALPTFLILDTVDILTKVCQVVILLRVGVWVCAYSTDDLSYMQRTRYYVHHPKTNKRENLFSVWTHNLRLHDLEWWPLFSGYRSHCLLHVSTLVTVHLYRYCQRWSQYICTNITFCIFQSFVTTLLVVCLNWHAWCAHCQ